MVKIVLAIFTVLKTIFFKVFFCFKERSIEKSPPSPHTPIPYIPGPYTPIINRKLPVTPNLIEERDSYGNLKDVQQALLPNGRLYW